MKPSLSSLSFGSLVTSSPSSHYYPDLYSLLIFPLCLSRVVLHLFFSFHLFLCVVSFHFPSSCFLPTDASNVNLGAFGERCCRACACVCTCQHFYLFNYSQIKASKASYILKENRMHIIFTRDYFISSFCLEDSYVLSRLWLNKLILNGYLAYNSIYGNKN